MLKSEASTATAGPKKPTFGPLENVGYETIGELGLNLSQSHSYLACRQTAIFRINHLNGAGNGGWEECN